MPTNNPEVTQIFEETGALLKGHFILRSGLHSGHFFQCARVCEHMDKVSRLASLLLAELPPEITFETVLSPAMGGLVIGQEVARQSGARFLFAEKENDTLKLRRGFQLRKGERVLIVEDVITRGGRVRETIAIVEARQGLPVGIAVLVNRGENDNPQFGKVPVAALVQMSFPTYRPEEVPAEIRRIPAIKPGS